MELRLLRAWEIQTQNFGCTQALLVITLFYPIATFLGEQSMIFKLLYATDLSIVFLCIALANEIIEDNLAACRGARGGAGGGGGWPGGEKGWVGI